MIKNPTQVKNTQLIQANKMDKLIKDGEQVFFCMIRPWETHGITEAAKKEQIKQRGPKKDFAKVIDISVKQWTKYL